MEIFRSVAGILSDNRWAGLYFKYWMDISLETRFLRRSSRFIEYFIRRPQENFSAHKTIESPKWFTTFSAKHHVRAFTAIRLREYTPLFEVGAE